MLSVTKQGHDFCLTFINIYKAKLLSHVLQNIFFTGLSNHTLSGTHFKSLVSFNAFIRITMCISPLNSFSITIRRNAGKVIKSMFLYNVLDPISS